MKVLNRHMICINKCSTLQKRGSKSCFIFEFSFVVLNLKSIYEFVCLLM